MLKSLPKCAECGKPITGESMAAKDKMFHAECFRCNSCHQILDGTYYLDKGNYMCECCMRDLLPRCAKCCRVIEGEMLTVDLAVGGQSVFHLECFTCAGCS